MFLPASSSFISQGVAPDSVHHSRASGSSCMPTSWFFSDSTPTHDFLGAWQPLDSPNSYAFGPDGLSLFLDKPGGKIATEGNTNSRVAEGSTFNSTFTIRYGKVTYVLSGPDVAGVVTAAILLADQRDEIDVELVGGDPKHWQTNVFAPVSSADEPLYGTFGSVQSYPRDTKNVQATHSYTIDWSPKRIIWSVDGVEVRTLTQEDTKKDGLFHYPSHPSHLQFGIWDASSPTGTSEWARGPIDWNRAPSRMRAVFESVHVECPY
ncbi:glycoside hydrolase [Epithele typhae]|uniref:glycoside hydrolase n=1 Tax=Epithele typhae TaxID=378194 RepID=UPI0020089B7A|nr:glycoside hydrolase [Epithele typhae]KAH9926330.1 glycoside hydrolase [Epithele typhae]